ncbi:hypothetical protein FB451DRAFT_104113 [Mycena latifolia]|nr:hypothetical protein FB451DRAFT_104113 [Mycena latifolia]
MPTAVTQQSRLSAYKRPSSRPSGALQRLALAMRLRLRLPGRAKLKPPSIANSTQTPRKYSVFPDVLWTSMCALRDSADAFPPLKSAVGGVLALWDIAERAQHAKSETRDIALRTKAILDLIADAVPDGSDIPPPMLQSIERFTVTLDEIRCSMEDIALSGVFSRAGHLKRNDDKIRDIKAQLDEAYRDFLTASVLRSEVHQTKTQSYILKVSAETKTVLFYSRFAVFLASP